jgi:hypothetical protein
VGRFAATMIRLFSLSGRVWFFARNKEHSLLISFKERWRLLLLLRKEK